MGQLSLVNHLVFMALTSMQAYEYNLTFALEISLIWNAPWTIPKVLFLLSRYWPFVTLTILLYGKSSYSLIDGDDGILTGT